MERSRGRERPVLQAFFFTVSWPAIFCRQVPGEAALHEPRASSMLMDTTASGQRDARRVQVREWRRVSSRAALARELRSRRTNLRASVHAPVVSCRRRSEAQAKRTDPPLSFGLRTQVWILGVTQQCNQDMIALAIITILSSVPFAAPHLIRSCTVRLLVNTASNSPWLRPDPMALRRLLVLWLLIVAVPMQAIAGSVRLHCVAAPATAIGIGHAGHEVAGGQGHHADSVHAESAHGMHSEGSATTVDVSASGPTDARPDRSVDDRCSACAMCHLGIALPTTSELLPSASREPLARPDIFAPVRSVTLAPLERPPRTNQV